VKSAAFLMIAAALATGSCGFSKKGSATAEASVKDEAALFEVPQKQIA
jgi:hypothetical protein